MQAECLATKHHHKRTGVIMRPELEAWVALGLAILGMTMMVALGTVLPRFL